MVTESPVELRREFYQQLDVEHMAPLWESLHSLVPKQPVTPAEPMLWRYDEVVRPHLVRAGELVTAEEAERRVLILENPGLRGKASITHSLYAGIQSVRPGEVAPAHRHVQSALRFILESSGGYTAVDGERTILHPGDFVLTPSMRWHDHGNETDAPLIWLDGLDIPTIAHFDAGFAETAPLSQQATARLPGDSDHRFGQTMLPVDWKAGDLNSPILNYPYSRSREALAGLARGGDPDRYHGHKLRFVNPATGGAPMPTIGAFMQLLPRGMETSPYRSTDGTIFVCVEGEGKSQIGNQMFTWRKNDVFVVPSWFTVRHEAFAESVLFSFSDRPAQQALGIWREERLKESDA
jgi:gentisate 1,2-dioxygenase